MTKLSGTSSQHFAGLAEAINTRGMTRSAKGAAGQGADDSSFHNLLNTVSNMAKRALSDQKDAGAVKPGASRARLVQAEQHDEHKDDTVSGNADATEQVDTPNKSAPIDHAAKLDIQTRLTLPSIVGQELAAVPALRQAPQPVSGETKGSTERPERTTRAGDVAPKTATAVLDTGTRPSVVASQEAMTSQGGAAASKPQPAATGFGAIVANVEHAAKFAGREALPETTKVSVLQQETHLPPVPQFSPTQQVANAVVTELKGSPAAASPAATDLTATQGNAPDQPVKVLTISLDPPALGNVTVRLRLAGDAVSVHLSAERKETSQLLDQQRDSIRDLMHSAGYVADVAPVQHGALDGFQTGQGQSQPSFSGQQPSSDGRGLLDNSGASSGQSEGGTRQSRQERNPNQETRHEQDVASANRRGPVYL
jgi:chemotaxis protein MotD